MSEKEFLYQMRLKIFEEADRKEISISSAYDSVKINRVKEEVLEC